MSQIAGFIGGAYAGANPLAANETLVNWYPSAVESPGAPVTAELLSTPGVLTWGTASVSGCRGAWAGDGRCFFVFGDTLFEADASGTLTSRGTLVLDGNPVTWATNGDAGNQLLITSGGNAYCYDLNANTLTAVVLSVGLMAGVVNGIGVLFGQAQFRISDLFDLATWDPLNYAQRTTQPDLWQAMLVDPYGYIRLIGSKTGEAWAGTEATFPFAPVDAGNLEEGIAAPFSLCQAGKRTVWLATNGNGGYTVQAAQGFQAQRISTHALERAIKGYAVVSDAFGQTYEDEGHSFYLLTFPSARVTWCYDFTTGLWHRRGTYQAGAFTYWRAGFHCFAFGKHLAGDLEGATVFEVTDASHVDADGAGVVRERQFYAGGQERELVAFDSLTIVAQPGVGLTTGSAADVTPVLMLDVSNDDGQTFGVQRTATIGALGDYDRPGARWWGLGMGRGRVYRVRSSVAVPVRLAGAFQTVRPSLSLAVR